ncbi:STAS domain-containing protein [Streptomyces sp. NPDC008121]|uniref:STAS domain-containing protein n=1 Tax=Streptomyces sp. NPDC008121 TaxID=3364809 RepID=UPI0036E51D61
MRLHVQADAGDGHVRVLRCEGELDLSSANDLLQAGENAALQPGVERLVLDVSGVTFADSSGLNCLIRLNQIVPVVLSGPLAAQLRRLLQITGAEQLFPCADSVETARTM